MPPETSIVIRTLNEGKHLEKLLLAIYDQTYTDWEIILVDSGSTDDTVNIAEKYTPNIYHMRKEDFTFGRSLNIGCSKANGKYLVFVSAHIYPLTNTWLSNLITPLNDPKIGMVYGSQRVGPDNSVAEERSLLSNFGNSSRIMIDEPAGHNGNSAIRHDLWTRHPFDERLTGLEDMAWAKLIQRDSYRVFYSSDARIVHIHEESLKQVYKRFFREALAYKYIFPSYRLSRLEAIKMFFHWTLGDIFYCLRNPKSPAKWTRIIPERYLECTAKYSGNHYHSILKKEFLNSEPVLQASTVTSSDILDAETGTGNNTLIKLAYVSILKPPYVETDTDGIRKPHNSINIAFSGIVVGIGNKSTVMSVGDKIVGTNTCNTGIQFQTDDASSSEYGSLIFPKSGYLSISSSHIQKIPDEITLREAPIVGYLAMCISILEQLTINPDTRVCVVGAGLIGSMLAQILSNRGIKVTVISDNISQRELLWKYDVNTLTEISGLNDFDLYINTTDVNSWYNLLVESKNNVVQVVDVPIENSKSSSKIPRNSLKVPVIRLKSPTQQYCDSASRHVTHSKIDLSDYINTISSISIDYLLSQKEKPPFNILIEISPELALI